MDMSRHVARYKVTWKIALIGHKAKDKPAYLLGRTHDLTQEGTGMLTHKDLFSESPVVLLLALPPTHRNGRQKVIEIRARQIYSVYSGETSCFRLGFEFISYKRDGFAELKEGLSHHRPILTVPSCGPFSTACENARARQLIQG